MCASKHIVTGAHICRQPPYLDFVFTCRPPNHKNTTKRLLLMPIPEPAIKPLRPNMRWTQDSDVKPNPSVAYPSQYFTTATRLNVLRLTRRPHAALHAQKPMHPRSAETARTRHLSVRVKHIGFAPAPSRDAAPCTHGAATYGSNSRAANKSNGTLPADTHGYRNAPKRQSMTDKRLARTREQRARKEDINSLKVACTPGVQANMHTP